MKRCFAAFALGLAIVSTLSADDGPRPLVIAAEDWPPFEYVENGVPKGINVEVIGRIMGHLKVPYEFKFYPFARSWMLLEKGKVDAIPSISYQPYREDQLYFTDDQRAFLADGRVPRHYLWVSEYVGFVNKRYGDSLRFESYEQIKRDEYKIGVVRNYSYSEDFQNAALDTRVYSTARAALQGLSAGKVDMVPMERTVGTWIASGLGLAEQIIHVDRPFFSKPYHLAFSRKSDFPGIERVWRDFSAELRKMRESGEYQSIYEQYIRPAYLSEITRPFVFVCEEWAPFEYYEDGKIKGIDVGVTDRIMKRLGIPYEIKIYPWSRAWMMAEKGKADGVLSVSFKSSREKVLHYTPGQRRFAASGEFPADYLWISHYVFFIKKQFANRLRFESYDQIKQDGLRVGRNKDYSYDQAFLDARFEGEIFSGTKEGLLALVAGEIDLYPMDLTVGRAALQSLGLEESVAWLPEPLFSKPYLSPFCRGSEFPALEEIMHAFYRELRLMRASGEYEQVYNGHFDSSRASEEAGEGE